MLGKEDFNIIKEIPAKKAEIKDLQERSAKLESTKESLSPDTYNQLAEKYRNDLSRFEEELKAAQQKAEQISVEIGFDIDKAEEKMQKAADGLSELDTLESSGAISAEDAKAKRKSLETQKRQAEREAAKNRKDRDLVQQYLTAESPEDIKTSGAAGGGAGGAGGDFMDKVKTVPKKVYIAAGAGLAGIAVIIVLLLVLTGGGKKGIVGDFLSYVPSEAIKDSSIELYHIDIDALDSSSATEALFGSDPIDIVNDEVTYRLEDDYFFEDFNPRTVSSLAVLYSSELDDDICYVYAKYDRERFIEKLEDEEFVREDYENIEFYTDGYEAVIPLKNGFLLCDDDDIMVLLETKTGKKESILDSGMEEKEFSLKYSDSHLGFMIAGGYYDNLVSGGVWQMGKKLKMRMLAGYPDKDQADQFAKSFEELMKGQKEGGGLGSFDISRVNDRTLQITITGIVDQEVMEMFF